MKTDPSLIQNKKEFRLFVTSMYPELIKLKQNGYRESFNQVLIKITLKLRAYIKKYLKFAHKKGFFSKNEYKLDAVVSELFIEIYDCIEDVQSDKDLHVWLYETTHILLEDISVEEGFNDYFYKNIENFSNEEWDKMEDKYLSDDDLSIEDEHDDRASNHYSYILDTVFIENKVQDPKGQLSKTLKGEPVKNHMAMVLYNLPSAMRDVFELYTNEYLEPTEIAIIHKTTTEKVNELLNNAREAIKVSVFKRYFN